MDCYIGLDIGTSAVKGALLSIDGRVLATESGEFEYYSKMGGKLMKPRHFLDVCKNVVNTLADSAGECTLRAICPSCASGNLILLDKDNMPLTPIIGWQSAIDREEFDSYYTKEELDEIYQYDGWFPVPMMFPLSYLPWLRKNKPEIYKKTAMFAMSAEYLNFHFTGKWGISHSMATPSYLADQDKGCYNTKLLKKLDIEESRLPAIMSKGTVLGDVLPDSGLNVPAGTKIVLGSFDHPSGATGAGVYKPGEMLLSCGTSWVEFFPVESRSKAMSTGLLTDRYMLSGAPYCAMASLESVSIKIANLRRQLLGDISHDEFSDYAARSIKGCNGLEFSFDSDDEARATGYDKCHIARAIIETAAKLLKKNLEDACKKGLPAHKITIIGGITNSDVCTRIIAETLGQKIRVVNGVSAGAVGSAMLAAIGVGAYKNEEDAFAHMKFTTKTYDN